ncbi:MAG TPA: serine hydrolase domain-containing protein, partial [Ktedonobacterales bacterium]|nr:serine hydrolase domain-containing protein [Ktedonobacterales bacterium]
AAAILLLQEQGALSVRDTLSRWLPECPEEWKPITLHHLLTHTSGIGHWRDFPALSLYQPITRSNLLRIFQQLPLRFPPGAGWAYSSPGYVLLAHIVEQISGETYASFLERTILRPLGMASAGAGNHAPQPERQAVGYAGKKPLPSFDLDTVSIGAGDVWSTTHDLARWDEALMMSGMLLSAESLRALFTPHAAVVEGFSELPGAHYGYGWLVAEVGGHPVYFHPGDNSGFGALNIVLPASDSLLILLANDEDADLWKIGQHVLRETLGLVY